MTDAEQIESLLAENAALRQRIAQLEAAARPADTAADDRLERILAQAPIAVFETDADRLTRYWNPAAERLFGYSAGEMLGRNPYDALLRTRDPVEVRRGAQQMNELGWTESVHAATDKSGREILCQWVASFVTDADRHRTGIVCFCRDVTAQVHGERAKRESEALLAATFETVGIGLCLIDENGIFLRVNNTYCQQCGWAREELLGQHFSIVMPPHMREWATQGFNQMIDSGFVGLLPPIEVTVARRDGRPFIESASYSIIRLEDGRRVQVCAVTDITERKQLEEEQLRRTREAERDAADKSRLLAELDQKLDVIARQHQQIVALSAPVLDVWEGVLLLPLIGALDVQRVAVITEQLLDAVVARRARSVILDMTSLDAIDTTNAGYIARMVQSLQLLGTRGIITGIRPSTAQTMVQMGIDLRSVSTVRDLAQGLRECIGEAGLRPAPTPRPGASGAGRG